MDLKICEHCEIKIESSHTVCPVCGFNSILKEKSKESRLETNLVRIGLKNFLLDIMLVLVLIPIGITLVMDYMQDGQFEWSMIISLSIFVGWLYLFLILHLWQHLIFLSIIISVITSVYLYTLNFLNNSAWFKPLGLPLSLGLPFITLIFIYLIKHSKNNLFKIIAWILLAATCICVYIDVLYTVFLYGKYMASWSLITSGILFPLSLLFFFLSNHRSLVEKWFHY